MIEFLVTSSVLILAVIALRLLFRGKIGRRLQYALWLPVLLRLLMPFPLPGSPFSVMNAVPAAPQQAPVPAPAAGGAAAGVSASAGGAVLPVLPAGTAASPSAWAPGAEDILRLVWLIGAAAVGLWFLGANLAFYLRLRRTRKACSAADCPLPVYVSRAAVSPCLFGFPRPAIYLTPKAAEGGGVRYVLAHELCHFRHGDHVWAVLRGVCLAAYWWDPLVWAAAVLSRDDGEFACDEAVVRRIGEENRLDYGRTLVDMVAVKKIPSGVLCTATTMASGKHGIKARLNLIVRNPKTLIPVFAAVIVVAAVCIAATFTGALQGNGKPSSSVPARSAAVSAPPPSTSAASVSASQTAAADAQKLYDSRVRYIGDNSADSALLLAIGLPNEPGGCTMELETEEKPYVLRVVFGGTVADPAALDKAMSRKAALLLALIDNASEIQWRYCGADPASGGNASFSGSLNEGGADTLLGGDIKACGKSAEQVQALLDRLNAGIPALDGNRAQSISETDGKNLGACVSKAILSHNAGRGLKGKYATESHTVLKTAESGNTFTVYAVMLYLEFNYPDGVPSDVSGCHTPVAITFERDSGGAYHLKEYWEPEDGSNYASSIRSKFPADVRKDALDLDQYGMAEEQACYANAIGYGKVDTDAALSKLLKTVCSSPAGQSSTKAYLDAHPLEYQRMTYYGSYMLRWSFARFEKGGQTGLEGSVMASACRDILGKAEAGGPAATGQAWYDAFKKSAEEALRKNGDAYMKKSRPGARLLLQMLGEV